MGQIRTGGGPLSKYLSLFGPSPEAVLLFLIYLLISSPWEDTIPSNFTGATYHEELSCHCHTAAFVFLPFSTGNYHTQHQSAYRSLNI
jgi:hypothetical protein